MWLTLHQMDMYVCVMILFRERGLRASPGPNQHKNECDPAYTRMMR
jgi:hypothetical protein